MASPRKFSEKIALLNQKQAEETAAFEKIIREVADVTSRAASASSSVGASPTGSTGHQTDTLSVKSAGASPPQSNDKYLGLGNMYRGGGSLPNVNNNNDNDANIKQQSNVNSVPVHSIDFKTVINNLEEMQQNQISGYTNNDRGRSMGSGGPMRSRPIERRHDTSPYSGVPYLSPPLPETWRRTNSDSALHQSANECQSNSQTHRRGSDTYQRPSQNTDNRDSHHNFLERPRSSCDVPRVPGINVYPSSQPPGQQIPIGNNTGSLPDLSNVHFPSPLHNPIDQDDHSSGSPYSNNHLSVPVPCRYLQSCKQGIGIENNVSNSQQDVRLNYSPHQQQQQTQSQQQPQSSPLSTSPVVQQTHHGAHSPVQYNVYQQPLSPAAPQSPNSQAQIHQQANPSQYNTLNSYRTSQMVNRPSPQSSPSLTVQGSPLSYSNNPSSPSSPTGHVGPPNLSLDQDASFFLNQVHDDFAQFSMMDSVSTSNIGYMNSPNHTVTYSQTDMINVANELAADTSYFNTNSLQQMNYCSRVATGMQQLAPQAPNTPTITLTDCSLGPDDLGTADFTKDLPADITASFGQDLFQTDDPLSQELNSLQDLNAIRHDLDPLDLDELQRLASSDMVISDPTAEAHFRLEQH